VLRTGGFLGVIGVITAKLTKCAACFAAISEELEMQRQQMLKGFTMALSGVFVLALAGAAIAQMGQQRGQQPSALEREYMEIQQRLAQAQDKAFENNPELRDKAEALEELVTDKMRGAGYDLGDIMETMLATQAKMQEARTDAQRREIMESREAREAQRKMQEAQRVAMEDPEVQAAQQQFEEDMLAAMRREDPETDRLFERLQEIQREAQRSPR